ncbi:MAG: polyprenyl synthetase family protein [Gemmatimonadales bacterium]|nr:MAG: polyprenyl synthetase family protein [Gemmatimonadales bacterium]
MRREREWVEAALLRALDRLLPELPAALAAPVRLGVTTGGKRLRPILFVSAYRAARGPERPVDQLYDLAAPLELIHAYSLIHDDLPCMDDAPLRRGQPTPHAVYGEAEAVLAGATLIPAAGRHLWWVAGEAGVEPGGARELLRLLARAAGGAGMVGGQALDLDAEGRALDRMALDDLHRRKTGALLTAALEMGGVAAGASADVRGALVEYGREIGLAFQIADDVLDATQTAETLGKRPSDSELDKSTYVRLLGVAGARTEARSRVESAIRALDRSHVGSPELRALARYVVERGH